MRYYTERPEFIFSNYGEIYECNHPVYTLCTLYTTIIHYKKIGLAVIQQRYNEKDKTTWWGPLAPWLTDPIYTHPKFMDYFLKFASEPDKDGLYPTVTVRQIMWALRMKPLKREPWETVFDRCPV